jgi:hypothetical protein
MLALLVVHRLGQLEKKEHGEDRSPVPGSHFYEWDVHNKMATALKMGCLFNSPVIDSYTDALLDVFPQVMFLS